MHDQRLHELEQEVAELRKHCRELQVAIENLQRDRDQHVRAYRILYDQHMHAEGQ